MANIVFDYAVGRYVEKFKLPIGGDNILIVLLQSTGLDADSILMAFPTLAALLAANTEATFTNYSRKTLSATGITVTTNTTTHITTVDIADQTWTSAGGTTNNTLGALITCYRKVSTDADSAILPLTKHDVSSTTTGNDLKATIPSIGTAKWSAS